MKTFNKIILSIAILGLLFTFAACSKAEKADVNQVKTLSDPMAQKIAASISQENYTAFTDICDQKMKQAITEQKFKEIVSQLGKCDIQEIIGADKMQGYTRAYYKAKSSKMSKDITLTVVISVNGNDTKLSGLFYK